MKNEQEKGPVAKRREAPGFRKGTVSTGGCPSQPCAV